MEGRVKTDLQAKTGALCESIERYSAMYHGKTYSVHAAFKDLAGAIHPNELMLYSEQQFAEREKINRYASRFYSLIPIPFDEQEEMEWTPVYSLSERKFKYLPTCFCFAQYPAEDETRLYSYPDSNGLAAGNSIEEAILQGFLELVERDAAGIWWYNQIQRPGVDLLSAQNPYFDEILAYYESINRKNPCVRYHQRLRGSRICRD